MSNIAEVWNCRLPNTLKIYSCTVLMLNVLQVGIYPYDIVLDSIFQNTILGAFGKTEKKAGI